MQPNRIVSREEWLSARTAPRSVATTTSTSTASATSVGPSGRSKR